MTVAVIGGGHAVGVPRAHRALAAAILASGGAIVSEYAPDVAPTKGTFPAGTGSSAASRRRPSSSRHPLAAAPSSRLGTRSSRVAPCSWHPVGPVTGRRQDAWRCCARRRRGRSWGIEELLLDLGLGDTGEREREPAATGAQLDAASALAALGPVERAVAWSSGGPASIDAIVRATGHPASVVAGALTLLQLRGWTDAIGPLQLPAGPLLRGPARPQATPHERTRP